VWTYTIGPFLAFLPQPWRKKHLPWLPVRWGTAGFFSGLLEAAAFFPLLIWWYSYFVTAFGQALAQSSSASNIPEGREGLVGLGGFAMNPITWLVCIVLLEGLVRAAGTMAGGEARGTIFLAAPFFVLRKLTTRPAAPELPLVRDEVTPGRGGDEIQIAACRAKADWKYPFTIRYGGGYFQVVAEKNIGVGPRPYIYSLRRVPAGEIAQGLREYDTADVLSPMERVQPVEQGILRQATTQAPGATLQAMKHQTGQADFGKKYFIGPFVSLLPQGWREAVFQQSASLLIPGAILSGAAEVTVALLWISAWMMGTVGLHWTRQETFYYTTLVGYLGIEGLLRAYLALTAGEVHGIFVLGILESIVSLATRPAGRPKLMLVEDEVKPGGPGGELRISSCREKRDWKYPYTIRYEGTFFQVTSNAYQGAGPRPYVYMLRRLPPGEIAGGLKDYNPRDILVTGKVDRVKWK
jgi:hypothetical protein